MKLTVEVCSDGLYTYYQCDDDPFPSGLVAIALRQIADRIENPRDHRQHADRLRRSTANDHPPRDHQKATEAKDAGRINEKRWAGIVNKLGDEADEIALALDALHRCRVNTRAALVDAEEARANLAGARPPSRPAGSSQPPRPGTTSTR
jgi:hypothetical protein